jgi:carbon-monoxide dehydrogenase medium subunit
MKPARFDYLRPATRAEALQMLHDHRDGDAKILAGGQSLVPMMNFRMAQPETLIDINRLDELAFVEDRGATIAIGALTRHNDVMAHLLVTHHLPLVAAAYANVAHHTIRNRGTIGGNVVHADAASEMPAVLTALDACFRLDSTDGSRTLPAAEFFVDVFTTGIEPHELLSEIEIAKPPSGTGTAFEEVSLRTGDFAITSIAAEIHVEDGRIVGARLAIGGIAGAPFRASLAETRLVGSEPTPNAIGEIAAAQIKHIEFFPTPGVSAAYRRDATRALLERTVLRAADRSRRSIR